MHRDRGASHHQYFSPGGLRRAVAQRKGIVAEGGRGERLSWSGGKHPSDCRIFAESYQRRPVGPPLCGSGAERCLLADVRISYFLFLLYILLQRSVLNYE